MNALVSRRDLLQAGGVALGAAALPALISATLSAETPPERKPAALPVGFDPAAFVADLKAAGYGVVGYYAVPCGGEPAKPPTYVIRPPRGRGFDATYGAVMEKWADAMDACPDHIERVVDYVFQQARRAAA